MRPMPHLPARVVWEEGMYLAPQHFQAQGRHVEQAIAHAVDVLFPYAWGVAHQRAADIGRVAVAR